MINCDQVLTQNLRHYMLHMLRSPTESGAVEVGRSRLQNGDVAYGSQPAVEDPEAHVRFAPDQRTNAAFPASSPWGQGTKSLRSSPLRGGKSREAGSQLRG
jgi:hypothetical protein